MDIRSKLAHAVTEYDRKQSTKRGYNIYALSHYLGRVAEIEADINAGADPAAAIKAAFSGRLLDACLKAIGAPRATDAEQRGGVFYQPVAAKGDA